MDEFDRGMEPQMRRYLKKVLNTLFVGLFWMIFMAFLGLYFGWAIPFGGHVDGMNVAFYCLFALSLAGLIWYFWRTWKT